MDVTDLVHLKKHRLKAVQIEEEMKATIIAIATTFMVVLTLTAAPAGAALMDEEKVQKILKDCTLIQSYLDEEEIRQTQRRIGVQETGFCDLNTWHAAAWYVIVLPVIKGNLGDVRHPLTTMDINPLLTYICHHHTFYGRQFCFGKED